MNVVIMSLILTTNKHVKSNTLRSLIKVRSRMNFPWNQQPKRQPLYTIKEQEVEVGEPPTKALEEQPHLRHVQ